MKIYELSQLIKWKEKNDNTQQEKKTVIVAQDEQALHTVFP